VIAPAMRYPRYSRRGSLWHRSVRGASVLLVVVLGSAGRGCSYKLGSLLKDKDETPAYTAAAPSTASDAAAQAVGMPSEADLAFARAAASEALTRGGRDVSVPWENPRTGARGTVASLDFDAGRRCMPRFPGELRARGQRSMAAGRSLPHPWRQVGGSKSEAVEALLSRAFSDVPDQGRRGRSCCELGESPPH
jgi:hypothetical protein